MSSIYDNRVRSFSGFCDTSMQRCNMWKRLLFEPMCYSIFITFATFRLFLFLNILLSKYFHHISLRYTKRFITQCHETLGSGLRESALKLFHKPRKSAVIVSQHSAFESSNISLLQPQNSDISSVPFRGFNVTFELFENFSSSTKPARELL